MTEQSSTRIGPKFSVRRRFRLLLVGLVAAAILVTAGWFAVSRLYVSSLESQLTTLREQGVTVDCADRRVGGFPARIQVRCESVTIADQNGTEVLGGGLTTVAPAWNPTLTIVEWTGPIRASGIGSEPVEFDTDLLRSSIRLDRDFSLQRLSIVSETLTVLLPSLNVTLSEVGVGEFHARRPEQASGTSSDLDIALLLSAVSAPTLERFGVFDLSFGATAKRLSEARGNDPRSILFDWITRSGEFEDAQLTLTNDAQSVAIGGSGRVAGDGRLSFDGTIATSDVGALLSSFGVGNATTSSAIAAGAALFGRQTEIDGVAGIELPLVVQNGNISIGPAQLGELPPFQVQPGN
ncbi:MAG: DUF2125 domain-containing protein [Pseudomonadota bacterium]